MIVKLSDFNEQFRTRLYNTIKEIENQSVAEVVVIIRSSSSFYRDIALWSGFVLQVIITMFMLFSPIVFDPYVISFTSLLSFLIGFLLVSVINPIKRLLVPTKQKNSAVELYARALFQKGKIYYTKRHTGLLIFVSLFERKVFFVPDIGVITAIPEHLLKEIENKFNNIFNGDDFVTEALLRELVELKILLSEFLPPVENDINEIPDDLEIEL